MKECGEDSSRNLEKGHAEEFDYCTSIEGCPRGIFTTHKTSDWKGLTGEQSGGYCRSLHWEVTGRRTGDSAEIM